MVCFPPFEYHPDKLRQRGETMTAEKQAKFTRMKDAYEVCGAARSLW
jgi:DnaJ-class molecular chaperone